jgi:parallel beta-helix repeat protein
MKSLRFSRFFLLAVSSAFAIPALGATLCVTTSATPGCFTHISDAVAAASAYDVINVGSGTYFESVVISKPLSVVGTGNSTIDATGLTRGIFVSGSVTSTLPSVHISGFIVQNANLEGILVLNATDVSISSNTVLNNNKALVNGNCTMLPDFEPGEAQDCGEGIHLQAADHSIVTNNTVQGNAGGILISDDTGPSHHNVISLNTVTDNPYACGITMASHTAATITGSLTPLGVFQNLVFGNRSKHNGYSTGGGAGVGIFASVPGAKSYGNVVVANLASENGHPGISLHAHAPGQSLNDNMIVGNTIVDNGADTGDAATPGPTGINVFAMFLSPAPGNIIANNSIQNDSYDVVVSNPALVQVQFNSLLGTLVGVDNQGSGPSLGPVDATENWWGCPNGPPMPGSCTSVLGGVTYLPALQNPPTFLSNY